MDMEVPETGHEDAPEAGQKVAYKLAIKMMMNLIMETQLNRLNPRYTTKEVVKMAMEAKQVVWLLSVMVAGVYLVYKF